MLFIFLEAGCAWSDCFSPVTQGATWLAALQEQFLVPLSGLLLQDSNATSLPQQCHLVASWNLFSHEKVACIRGRGVWLNSSFLLNSEHSCRVRMRHHPNLLSSFFPGVTQGMTSSGVLYPCLSAQSWQHKAHVPGKLMGKARLWAQKPTLP